MNELVDYIGGARRRMEDMRLIEAMNETGVVTIGHNHVGWTRYGRTTTTQSDNDLSVWGRDSLSRRIQVLYAKWSCTGGWERYEEATDGKG